MNECIIGGMSEWMKEATCHDMKLHKLMNEWMHDRTQLKEGAEWNEWNERDEWDEWDESN